MLTTVREIEKVIRDEVALYHQLYDLEEEKSAAIMERDGARIEGITREQEALLRAMGGCEKRRLALIDEYVRDNHINDLPRDVTLSQIVSSIDEDSSHRMLLAGMELRKILAKVQLLQETNRKLLDDNLAFFNILLSTLKESVSMKTGYSGSGVEDSRVSQSLIFNRRF